MPGGYGQTPFGFGPYGQGVAPFAYGIPTTSVAWKIDPITQDYVMGADGNAVGMDGTDQRVELICVNAEIDIKIITPSALDQQRQAYLAALQPLVADLSISNLVVTVTDGGGQLVKRFISYKNNGTSQAKTIEL
jgi:hypothetical protein